MFFGEKSRGEEGKGRARGSGGQYTLQQRKSIETRNKQFVSTIEDTLYIPIPFPKQNRIPIKKRKCGGVDLNARYSIDGGEESRRKEGMREIQDYGKTDLD